MFCIFCQIITKQAPADIIKENKDFIAFKDIHPKAAVHLLVVPKKHILSLKNLTGQDQNLIGGLLLFAKELAQEQNLKGYKLLFNVGREGGQIVEHVHLHLLGGKLGKLP